MGGSSYFPLCELQAQILYKSHTDLNFFVTCRYEIKTYNEWTKALSDHIIVDYFEFKLPDKEDLDVSKSKYKYRFILVMDDF